MRRPSSRGLTLIELTIAMAIAALVVAVSMVSVNALTDAELKSAAVELTGAIKFSYDRAIMEKRTQRIAFDLDKGLWWLDFTEDRYALARERLSGDTGDQSREDLEEKLEKVSTLDDIFAQLDDFDADVKKVVEGRGQQFTPDDGAGEPRRLPGDIRFTKVWTGHQEEPFTKGVAYLHFWKGGFTEPAQIELSDGADEYITLKVFPLTGRVRMYPEQLEDPKVEDVDGRDEGDE